MKKLIAFLLAAFMVMSFAACGQTNNQGKDKPGQNNSQTQGGNSSKPENGDKNNTVTVKPSEIEAKIKKALGEGYVCTADKEMSGYFSLDMEKVEAYAAKESSIPAVDLDTVIILKVKDGYADDAVKALNEGYAQMVDYVRQYPFGTAKIMNGRVFQNGNYVALIVAGTSVDSNASAEQEEKQAESEYAQIDAVWKEIFGEAKNVAVIPEDNDNGGENFFDGGNGGLIGG